MDVHMRLIYDASGNDKKLMNLVERVQEKYPESKREAVVGSISMIAAGYPHIEPRHGFYMACYVLDLVSDKLSGIDDEGFKGVARDVGILLNHTIPVENDVYTPSHVAALDTLLWIVDRYNPSKVITDLRLKCGHLTSRAVIEDAILRATKGGHDDITKSIIDWFQIAMSEVPYELSQEKPVKAGPFVNVPSTDGNSRLISLQNVLNNVDYSKKMQRDCRELYACVLNGLNALSALH